MLPKKYVDQGSFTLNCKIGGASFDDVLCDTRASLILIAFSCFMKLKLEDKLRLEASDNSIKLANNKSTTLFGVI